MIIFYKDWDKYPLAIMDTKTLNKSFYIQAIKYKIMGVKNHAFMLSLMDPSLQGVDPFDEENLTREMKDRIIIEVMTNPWYFFREIMKVSLTGGGVSHLKANRANIALVWMFLNHIFTILIQIRQTGKSLNTDGIKAYALFFGVLDSTITFLTNNNKNRQESVERIRSIEKTLPTYLKVISANDINNMDSIYIKATKNRYETAVAQASVELAKSVFRGKTSPIQHIDEAAYITNLKESLSAMLKAGNAARDQAAENNSLYGTIMSTTAGYKDTTHGRYMYNTVYKTAAIFTEKMFDSEDIEALESMIRGMSPNKLSRVLIEMNHRQLGKSDDWLAGKIEDTNSEGNDTLTDFFNIWVDSKGVALLSEDDMKKINDSKLQNYSPTISPIEGYTMRWYVSDEYRENLKTNGEYLVAGMDTSEAMGNDDISLVLTSLRTGEVVAAADFNETNTTIFGTFIAQLLIDYPNLLLNIERRSTGTSMIDTIVPILLQKNINPLHRLFNWIVNDCHLSDTHKERYKELMVAFERRDRSVFDRYKKYFGFSTSGGGRTSRNKLYGETFKSAVKYIGSQCRDVKLINQILGLKDINGRIDHDPDDHDDMVIAWLLSFWTLKNASNLKMYGININNVLVDVRDVVYKNGEKDIELMKKQKIHNNAMSVINKLTDVMSESTNEIEVRNCKMLMKRISKTLDYTVAPNFNIDIYIEKLEKEKQLKRKLKG